MENKRGRPKIYFTEKDRKDAIKKSKTKYMLNKEWYCDVCKTEINYSLAGKWCHIKQKNISNIVMLQNKTVQRIHAWII